MKNTLIRLVAGFIFFGLALGLTFMLGDTLFDPIVAKMWSSGGIRYTLNEVIGQRILQVVGIFIIWTFAYIFNKVVTKEFTT